MATILVVDSEFFIRQLLYKVLSAEGHLVFQAGCGQIAQDVFSRNPIDLVLLEPHLPNHDGLSFIQEVRQCTDAPILTVTATHMNYSKQEYIEAGATAYLRKPFNLDLLNAYVRRLLADSLLHTNQAECGPVELESNDNDEKTQPWYGMLVQIAQRAMDRKPQSFGANSPFKAQGELVYEGQ